jgi:hypothetical protein
LTGSSASIRKKGSASVFSAMDVALGGWVCCNAIRFQTYKCKRNVVDQTFYLMSVHFRVAASVVQWSKFLTADPEVWARFPALSDFLRGSGSGKGSTQPREYN